MLVEEITMQSVHDLCRCLLLRSLNMLKMPTKHLHEGCCRNTREYFNKLLFCIFIRRHSSMCLRCSDVLIGCILHDLRMLGLSYFVISRRLCVGVHCLRHFLSEIRGLTLRRIRTRVSF